MMPLLIELLLPILAAYFAGIGIAWLFFGRPKREGYL